MQKPDIRFSLNHMVCPKLSAIELIDAACRLGLNAVELRNDIQDNSLTELKSAQQIGQYAREKGITIISINALYPFNIWNDERATQARQLAQLAQACGATGLVLCPFNEPGFNATETEKQQGLETALSELKNILDSHQLKGFVEPLGFPVSSMRFKREAVDAIRAINGESTFSLVHDTFHHKGAGETEMFPQQTGLVHISGLEDKEISFETMQDAHRVLVGPDDRLENIAQISVLQAHGFSGYFSFEPFSEAVWNLDDPIAATRQSMEFIQQQLKTETMAEDIMTEA